MKINNPERFPASKLNALYHGRKVIFGSLQGKIINIAYYSDLDSIPYAELELYTIDCRVETKIIKLSDVVLISTKAA